MLTARLHVTRSKANHLRVSQTPPQREDLKHALQRIGSPARWIPAEWAWDAPLNPAAVARLDEVAKQFGERIEWAPELKGYAEEHLKREDYEHQTRLAIERLIQDKSLPIEPYVCRPDKLPLRHQDIGYHWSLRVRGLLLAWEMGCVAGDAKIKAMRHGKVFPLSLRDLYLKFNRLHNYPWRKPGRTTCKSLCDDGVLRHNEIREVLHKGKRPTIRIRFSGGKSITCTPDHEIAVPGGWKPAGGLRAGDVVLTNGVRKYRKYAVGEGFVDKDGYRRIRMPDHPRSNGSGVVYEHLVVMENKLGRLLLPHESVRHLDQNKTNNHPDNLEVLHKSVHARLHAKEAKFLHMDGGTAGTGGEIIMVPRERRVLDVEDAGVTDVYDLVMADPARNFVASGVIVHNCGKTKTGADASAGWYRTGQVQPMRPILVNGKPGVAGGVLVVCPRSMLKTWAEELAYWQNAQSIIVYGSEARRKMRLAATPSFYHIVNWSGLKFTEHNAYAGVILDECHNMANGTTQSEKARSIAQRAQKVLALTGTPISNDLKSIFYPMLAVDGGRSLGPSRTAFLEKHFTSRLTKHGEEHDPKEGAATDIAKAVSVSTYFLKKTDAVDLPSKTHIPLYLEMTPEQSAYYQNLKQEALVFIQDAEVSIEQASVRMMKLMQVCQGFVLTDDPDEDTRGRHFSDIKTATILEMLTDQLRGKKVVLWCHFKYEIKRLRQALREAGIPHCCVDGNATQAERDEAKDRFNNDSGMLVHVRQISMSEGVTLLGTRENPCSNTIYLALNYRLVDILQSQDRIHRIGQHFPCTYHYLLTENGIDRMIYLRLLEKMKTADLVHTTGKAWYRELLEATP